MFNKILDITEKLGHKVAHFMGENALAKKGKISRRPLEHLLENHFLSQLLPYQSFDPETSLFFNKKSMGFILETTPLLGSSEEIENILTSIITDILPANVDMQFLLWASPKIKPILDAFEAARSKNERFAWLAKKRTDYLKRGAFSSLSRFGSLLLRDFRTFIVVSAPGKVMDGTHDFIGLRDDIESSLKSINVGSRVLNAQSFVTTFFDMITPSKHLHPHDARWNEHDSLASQLTDPEWRLQIKPHGLYFSSEEEAVEAICLSVRDYPTKATQWKTAENLGQLFNATLQIPCPFLISFALRKSDQEKATMRAQLSTMNREKTARSPLAKFKPTVNKEHEEWQQIRKRLSEGDSLVKTHYQIILFSHPDEAKSCEQRIRHLYRANGWKLRKESYLQLQSWLAALPMVMSEGMFDDLNYFGRLRTMTAFNAVNVAPLQGEWKGTRTPSLLLPGRRGQIALWNPFDNEGNFNIVIVAAPRKGKSALTNEYIMAIHGAGGRVWVIDVGDSYKKTCKELGGQFIEFSENTNICLNPFTLTTNINESMELLKPLLASMARPVTGATEEEVNYIEIAIKCAWESKGNKATISTVADWLAQQKDPIARNLSHLLSSYTKGSYSRFFEGECTIDFNNLFIVLELKALDGKKDLQRIIMQMLIFVISQAMYHGDRSQIKTCIIDEAWKQLNSNDKSHAEFIEAGYRTAPKYRGNFISIAHSIADYHGNRMSKAAFDCSDFKIILGQTDEAINKLKQENIMDIDGYTERLLKSLKITKDFSECVIKSPEGLSVHRILFDPYSRILYSTKGEEFEAVNQLVEQGLSLTDAIEKVVRKFNHA